MTRMQDVLATERVACWFKPQDDYLAYLRVIYACFKAVSQAVPWAAMEPHQWTLVPVYRGSSRDCPFDAAKAPSGIAEAIVFGISSPQIATSLQSSLGKLIGSTYFIGVSRPSSDLLNQLVMTELITHDTVISIEILHPDEVGLDPDLGLEFVTVSGENEREFIDMAKHDFELLMPPLVRLIGRNLRTWIRSPRQTDSPGQLVVVALRLLRAGAADLAAVVGGRALERELKRRIGDESCANRTLHQLINVANASELISDEEATRMRAFKALRNRAAHAVSGEAPEVPGAEVEEFLNWFRSILRKAPKSLVDTAE